MPSGRRRGIIRRTNALRPTHAATSPTSFLGVQPNRGVAGASSSNVWITLLLLLLLLLAILSFRFANE
jgi:hypothetical protein